MTSRWSHNLFKGRIGEAVTEAVLTEFGYVVTRGGFEQHHGGNPRYAPDLIVEYPPTGSKKFVEVKYRAARPTSVDLDRQRISEYREHYPGTILAINAAWNGAIYCCWVEDLPINNLETTDDITLSLLDDYWKHISEFFPIVQKGDRLGRLWTELKESLGSFGRHAIRGRGVETIWEGEHENLTDYLTDHWTDKLLNFGIEKPQPERMTLEELWEVVRSVNTVGLAKDLLDQPGDQPFDPHIMTLAIQRALGNRGEAELVVDIDSLTDRLLIHWDRLGFDEEQKREASEFVPTFVFRVLSILMKNEADPRHKELANRIIGLIPEGYLEASFLDPAIPFENTERFDLKTAIKLMTSPCRING